jgi:deazaflavin-dependent oxidoreductase (nitroreductase family)
VRVINAFGRFMTRRGMGPEENYLLTVVGRQTGHAYTVPVSLVLQPDKRWAVAPYGEVAWVKNARAAGRVTLTRGKSVATVGLTEVTSAEAAPILKAYLAKVRITRPYFDVRFDAPVEAFEAEAPRHPVFLIGPDE